MTTGSLPIYWRQGPRQPHAKLKGPRVYCRGQGSGVRSADPSTKHVPQIGGLLLYTWCLFPLVRIYQTLIYNSISFYLDTIRSRWWLAFYLYFLLHVFSYHLPSRSRPTKAAIIWYTRPLPTRILWQVRTAHQYHPLLLFLVEASNL